MVADNNSNNAGTGASDESRCDVRPLGPLVRYGAMSWVGEFTARITLPPKNGQAVVVQTERGIELGEHVWPYCPTHAAEAFAAQTRAYVNQSGSDFCRPRAGRVLRLATDQDRHEQAHLNAHINDDVEYCAHLANELKLNLRVVTAEHLLGGERIVFYFSAPTRVDFRQLVRQLAQRYRTRIEMRQVGARDEARLVADYEVCGRECCCKNFLKKLRPVNMKMAKLQKSTLDPSKVSGRCGRLRCCLRYEHDGYEELVARLPRNGVRVETESGCGVVTDQQVLTQLVQVRLDDERVVVVPLEEIKAFNVPPPAPRPAPPPRAEEKRPSRDRQRGSEEDREERRSRRRGRRRRPERNREESAGQKPDAPSTSERESREPVDAENNKDDGASGSSRRRRRRRPRRRPGDEGDSDSRTPPADTGGT